MTLTRGRHVPANKRALALWTLVKLFKTRYHIEVPVCLQMKSGYMRLQSLCRSRELTHQFALFRTKMMTFQVNDIPSILTVCLS